jgi:hypothetical protein
VVELNLVPSRVLALHREDGARRKSEDAFGDAASHHAKRRAMPACNSWGALEIAMAVEELEKFAIQMT